MSDDVEINIQNVFAQNYSLSLNWRNLFQIWLESLKDELPPAKGYELSLRLTDDQEIQTLNRNYRQQDQATDVLAFAALEAEIPQTDKRNEPLYLGDIVISLDTASRQAAEQKHSLEVELGWLATHGLLHLLGWDHSDDRSLTAMLNRQRILLSTTGLIE